MSKKKLTIIAISLLFICLYSPTFCFSQKIEYSLTLSEKEVHFTGKKAMAMAINDQIPGPTIKAKIGDILRITVRNNLKEESSIHWHGVLVPNEVDGVPGLTTPSIKAGEEVIYEFPVKHSGTFWYHSHSNTQEQLGIYGSIIFYPHHEKEDYDEEHIVQLSDWTNEHPDQVLANLKKDSDYYALKKDSVQSWFKILQNGKKAIQLRLENAWKRLGPMDLSDIGYDAFLINGQQSSQLSTAHKGKRIKLRIINSGASTYFSVQFAGCPMQVISADGNDIEPFWVDRLRIAIAETYDVFVTIPENRNYEFRASAEDGTGYASTFIGSGEKIEAPTLPKPNLVLMSHHGGGDGHNGHEGHNLPHKSAESHSYASGAEGHTQHSQSITSWGQNNSHGLAHSKHMDNKQAHSQHQNHSASTASNHSGHNDHEEKEEKNKVISYLNNYKPLKSNKKTNLTSNNPTRKIFLRLTGNMERYVWSFNDAILSEADKIYIQKGENLRLVLQNETMMNHPLHLHGHFFRVLNKQGDYDPLKHTVDIPSFQTVEIEFLANAEKSWFFHCHHLYHMKLGMARIFSYDQKNDTHHQNQSLEKHKKEHGNIWFRSTELNTLSNLLSLKNQFINNNDYLILDARSNYRKNFDIETHYKHYFTQFLAFYLGGRFEHEKHTKANRAVMGFHYMLPLLIESDFRIDSKANLRFGLSSSLQLTDRFHFDWEWNTDEEYRFDLSYTLTKWLYLTGTYDSREQWGAGLSFKF